MFYFKNYKVLFSDKIKEFLLCSPDGLAVNNQPAMQEMWVQSLGQEGHLDQEMATHPSILPGEHMDRGVWKATVHGFTKSQT